MGNILIVDDEPIFLETLCASLDELGHLCAPASSVDEAIALLSTRPFDLLLTDHDMPGTSGMGLIKDVKRRIDLHAIPVILLTGNPDPTIREIAKKVGAFQTIVKPFDLQCLLEAVSQALESKSSREES